MSVGALGGITGSAAGAPLSQTASSEAERTRDSAVQERGAIAAERAERAAGIGTTEQDQETSERDADGRRLWENSPENKNDADARAARQSKDPTGQCGTNLDLTG